MDSAFDPTQLFGGKLLEASENEVTAIILDSNVVIKVGTNREHEFRIENDIRLSTNAGLLVVHYDPYRRQGHPPKNVTELAMVVGAHLGAAAAFVDGRLELRFSHSVIRELTVEPNEKYEAWTYTFGSYILNSPPGGDLATSR